VFLRLSQNNPHDSIGHQTQLFVYNPMIDVDMILLCINKIVVLCILVFMRFYAYLHVVKFNLLDTALIGFSF